jgi:glucose dehydrogenase
MQAFLTMSGINLLLIAVLVFSGLQLLRARSGAVRVYNWFVLVTCVYFFSIGFIFWPMGGELGRSIAGATGIGNMGIGPFFFLRPRLPFVYPIVSLLVLNLIRRAQNKRSFVQPDQPQLPAS